METRKRKHMIVDMEEDGFTVNEENLLSYQAMGVTVAEVKQEIIDWLELVGAEEAEISDVKEERNLKLGYNKELGSHYMKIGEEWVAFQKNIDYQDIPTEEDDYVVVDGNLCVFYINKNVLEV